MDRFACQEASKDTTRDQLGPAPRVMLLGLRAFPQLPGHHSPLSLLPFPH